MNTRGLVGLPAATAAPLPLSVTPKGTDSGTVLRIKTEELVQLAPRLRPYLRTSAPAWPDIVEAADWLRHDWYEEPAR